MFIGGLMFYKALAGPDSMNYTGNVSQTQQNGKTVRSYEYKTSHSGMETFGFFILLGGIAAFGSGIGLIK